MYIYRDYCHNMKRFSALQNNIIKVSLKILVTTLKNHDILLWLNFRMNTSVYNI